MEVPGPNFLSKVIRGHPPMPLRMGYRQVPMRLLPVLWAALHVHRTCRLVQRVAVEAGARVGGHESICCRLLEMSFVHDLTENRGLWPGLVAHEAVIRHNFDDFVDFGMSADLGQHRQDPIVLSASRILVTIDATVRVWVLRRNPRQVRNAPCRLRREGVDASQNQKDDHKAESHSSPFHLMFLPKAHSTAFRHRKRCIRTVHFDVCLFHIIS